MAKFLLSITEAWLLPLTVLMIALAVWDTIRPIGLLKGLEKLLARVADKRYASLALILFLAIGGPLALRPFIGVPDPVVPDEFSLMTQAKTYLSGRLANDALPPNFEALWVLRTPSHASQYPVLRSLPLVVGYATGIGAWGGVVLTSALLALAVFWLVRLWINARFALVAALIVILRFGLFTSWVNSYYGPALTALGGVLLLGGYKILRSRPRLAGGAAVGAGAAILMTTRPFEGLMFASPLAVALAVDFLRSKPELRALLAGPAAIAVLLVGCGAGLTAAANQAATGDWKVFPFALYRQETGAAPALFLQNWNPARAVEARYDWTRRNLDFDTWPYMRRTSAHGIWTAQKYRFKSCWSFYLGFALTLPFLLGLWALRSEPAVLASAGLLAVGLAVGSFDQANYAAPAFGFIVVATMLGFRALRRWRPFGAPFGPSLSRTLPLALVLVTAVPLHSALLGRLHPVHIASPVDLASFWLWPRSIHAAVEAKLNRLDGGNLVVVDTGARWPFTEVPIANDADLDRGKTIWINEDPEYDRQTIDRYSGRRVWRLSWLEGAGPCLQAFTSVTSTSGAPLAGDFASLSPDPERGWLQAPADACPGGLTREPWGVSARR